MSLLETNKPSVQNPKDLTNNIVDSSKPINDIASGASKISKPLQEEIPRYTLIPAEELEKKAQAKLLSYGGIKDLIGSHIVYATIKVAGEDILKSTNFSFTLNQKVANHHEFEIICSADEFNEQNNYPLENSQKLLGKRISIFLHQFSEVTFSFTGIITGLTNRKMNGYSKVILSGQSPTILLENGKDCLSYENKNLADIIKSATTEYPSDLIQWDIRPRFQDALLYTVQYKESDFDFIKRLATRYGEWFYYDGEQINIGGYGGKTTEILETQDFFEFELKMKLIPQKFSYVSYDAKQAKNHTVDSESIELQSPTNPYLLSALQASEEVYSKTPLSLYNHTLMESGEMELRSAITREKQKRQNAVYLEAKSNNPNLNLGDLVKINAWMPDFKAASTKEAPLETYRIIEIKHNYESTKGYSNEFIGVPKDNFGPPYTDEDAIPRCEEQSGVVTDNNDPEGMSRIRVQFPWQKPFDGQTPWVRVTTPYAGEGKGMHVIPEIGEEVMVSFENGNAEKPVVLGSMFNGKGKSGHGGNGNYMKGLATASGSSLMFNDQVGDMTLADKGGASMKFDGSGNASTSAAANHSVSAGAAANTSVGEDASSLKMDAGGNIILQGNTNITLIVGSSFIEITESEITINGETMKIIGNSRTEIGKPEAAQGMLVTNGGRTYINGSSEVVIKGDEVKIN